jgi:hypothetical protein
MEFNMIKVVDLIDDFDVGLLDSLVQDVSIDIEMSGKYGCGPSNAISFPDAFSIHYFYLLGVWKISPEHLDHCYDREEEEEESRPCDLVKQVAIQYCTLHHGSQIQCTFHGYAGFNPILKSSLC